MKKSAVIGLLCLALGLCIGYMIAQFNPDSPKMTPVVQDAATKEHTENRLNNDTQSAKFEVDPQRAPTINLIVSEDAISGWNIQLDTTNFKFTPQNVNTENVVGEGYAYLYIDGEKIARLYGPGFHYKGTFDGQKTFSVTLNTNDHREYSVEGKVISAEAQVVHEAHD